MIYRSRENAILYFYRENVDKNIARVHEKSLANKKSKREIFPEKKKPILLSTEIISC